MDLFLASAYLFGPGIGIVLHRLLNRWNGPLRADPRGFFVIHPEVSMMQRPRDQGALSRGTLLAGAVLWVALIASTATSQIPPPLDVECSAPILNSDGRVLPGSNPASSNFGYPAIPGAVVQILDTGPNTLPDLPNTDGSPGGDDSVFATTVIGQGIAPNITESGCFSTSFYPPPPSGAKLYARVFNGTTVDSSTRWGESLMHTVSGCEVMDVTELGLWITGQPKGTDPVTTDTDGDGHSDYEELFANTNADDVGDQMGVEDFLQTSSIEFEGRTGRAYRLLRSTDDLTGPMSWVEVAYSGTLNANMSIVLSDPNPPNADKAFYRLEVVVP